MKFFVSFLLQKKIGEDFKFGCQKTEKRVQDSKNLEIVRTKNYYFYKLQRALRIKIY